MRPAPTSWSSSPRGGKVAAQNAAVMTPRRDPRVLGRELQLGARCPAAARRARSPSPTSDTSAGGRAGGRGGSENQEGLYWRYEMAVRTHRVGPGGHHGRQRGDLRRPPRRVRGPRAVARPGHLVSVRDRPARPACRLRAAGRAKGADGPDGRRRVRAQAADEARTWGVLLRRMLSPLGYRPFTRSRSSRIACSATPRPSCTCSRSREPGAARRGHDLRGDARRAGRAPRGRRPCATRGRGRCRSPATTSRSRPPSPPGSGTTSAMECRHPGRRPRGPAGPPVRGTGSLSHLDPPRFPGRRSPVLLVAAIAIRLDSRGPVVYRGGGWG